MELLFELSEFGGWGAYEGGPSEGGEGGGGVASFVRRSEWGEMWAVEGLGILGRVIQAQGCWGNKSGCMYGGVERYQLVL